MDGFGERLRNLRKGRDITQSQLAAEIGVVASAVGKYERSPQAYPSVEALIKIADYFQVSTDYLLKGAPDFVSAESERDNLSARENEYMSTGNQLFSPEAMELLHIYENLKGRGRLKLLNYALGLEKEAE